MVFQSRMWLGKMLSQLLVVYHTLPVYALVVVLSFKTALEYTYNILQHSGEDGAIVTLPLRIVLMMVVMAGVVLAQRVFLNLLFDLLPGVEPFPRLRVLVTDLASVISRGIVLSDRHRVAIFRSPRELLHVLYLDPRSASPDADDESESDSDLLLFRPRVHAGRAHFELRNRASPPPPPDAGGYSRAAADADDLAAALASDDPTDGAVEARAAVGKCSGAVGSTRDHVLAPIALLSAVPVVLLLVVIGNTIIFYQAAACSRCPLQVKVCTACIGPKCSFRCEIYTNIFVVCGLLLAHFAIFLAAVATRPEKSAGRALSPRAADAAQPFHLHAITILDEIISSDANWRAVTSDVMYGSMLVSSVFFPLFAFLSNQGVLGGLGSYLVISTGHSAFYAVVWFLLHQVLFLYKGVRMLWVGPPAFAAAKAVVFFVTVRVVYALFPSVLATAIVIMSINSIVNMAWKLLHPPRAASSNAPRPRLRRRIIWWLSAIVLGIMTVMVLGTVQSFAVKGDFPDHFRVAGIDGAPPTPDALAVHFTVDGSDDVAAWLDLWPNGRPGKPPPPPHDDGYTFCSFAIEGLTLTDYGLLALASYLPPHTPEFDLFLGALFDDLVLVNVSAAVPTSAAERAYESRVRFYELYSPSRNVTIISIRGTGLFDLHDWVQDLDIWIETATLQFFSLIFPGLSIWPTDIVAQIVKMASWVEGLLPAQERHYHDAVIAHVRDVQARSRVVLVGHSLGGGLAKIVGASTHAPAVAVSGPGIVVARKRLGIPLRDISKFVVNIVPMHDLAGGLGAKGGLVANVECTQRRPDLCHLPMTAIAELVRRCNHPRFPNLAATFHSKPLFRSFLSAFALPTFLADAPSPDPPPPRAEL